MERNQWRLAVLAVLLAALAAIVVYRYWMAPASRPATASNVRTTAAGSTPAAGSPAATIPDDVRLDALNADRPTPVTGERNLFRFKPKAAPPPPPLPRGMTAGGTAPQVVPAGPPPPPPITLKFIGVLESADRQHKIAVLTDGRAAPQYGKEGDIILGQYKILRIGEESIEMSYVDGRGRQTIRLTGQ